MIMNQWEGGQYIIIEMYVRIMASKVVELCL